MRADIAIYLAKHTAGETPSLDAFARDFAKKRGREFTPSPVSRSLYGKPRYQDGNAPCFSISHSGELWGVALSYNDIGFDIEREKESGFLSIAKRFFSAEEYEYIIKRGRFAFFDVWTAKEAYVKLLGTGIDGGFHEFSTVGDGELATEANGVRFLHIPRRDGYHMTLAVYGKEANTEYETFNFMP